MSNATHVSNFGTASLWPFYMMFGAKSKYDLGKPSMHVIVLHTSLRRVTVYLIDKSIYAHDIGLRYKKTTSKPTIGKPESANV